LTHIQQYNTLFHMDGHEGRKLIVQLANQKVMSISDLFQNAGLNASIGTKFVNQTKGAADNLAPATYKKLADTYPDFREMLSTTNDKHYNFIRVPYTYICGTHKKMVATSMPPNQHISIPTNCFNADIIQENFKCISWGKVVSVPHYEGSYGLYREIDCREKLSFNKVPICIMVTEEETFISYARKAVVKGINNLDVLYASGEHAMMIPFDKCIACYTIEIIIPHMVFDDLTV